MVRNLSSAEEIFGRQIRINDVVAVVTLFGGGEVWPKCIESLVKYTSIPIVIFEDSGPSSEAIEQADRVSRLHSKEIWLYRQQTNLGLVGNLNSAFEILDPADVIVLNSDVIVGPEWSERLVDAARSRSDISTATALSTNGTIFTVEAPKSWANRLPSIGEVESAAILVSSKSKLIRPIAPVATAFCTLFTRQALNVVGVLDMKFSPGYGEEVDFSLRCLKKGFVNVAADDVYVYHASGGTFGPNESNKIKVKNDGIVSESYPFWDRYIFEFAKDSSASLNIVREYTKVVLHGMTVIIDSELIDPNFTGTFEGAIELTRSLKQKSEISRLIWVASESKHQKLKKLAKEKLSDGVDVLTLKEVLAGDRFDIALRPGQDYGSQTWQHIRLMARRNVIWHLDTIATHNPFYHDSIEQITKLIGSVKSSLFFADGVAVLGNHVKATLNATFYMHSADDRVSIIPNGSPDKGRKVELMLSPQGPLANASREPFLLVVGASFHHKNRVWVLGIMELLIQKGFEGNIVFLGPEPNLGSSRPNEASFLRNSESLSGRFFDLGMVSDDERNFLISRAELVLVPSVTEGFGMIPFESVSLGTPVVSTKGGGLGDICPESALHLTLQDNNLDAQTIWILLTSKDAARSQTDKWYVRAQDFKWSTTATKFIELFESSLSKPGRIDMALPFLNSPTPRHSDWSKRSLARLNHWGNLIIHWTNWLRIWSIRLLLKGLGQNTIRKKTVSRIYRILKGL
jgi:glycosyltransferase involved in cell wall biosynthesis